MRGRNIFLYRSTVISQLWNIATASEYAARQEVMEGGALGLCRMGSHRVDDECILEGLGPRPTQLAVAHVGAGFLELQHHLMGGAI